MLYQLGPLSIRVQPFNVDRVNHSASTDFVAKPVLGAEPPLEYVGEGANVWNLSGSLFPQAIGGLTELRLLQRMRQSGLPFYLQRGDGAALGWVSILKVTTDESHLGSNGVGRKIDVNISLRRAGRPSRLALATILLGAFQ